MPYDAELAGRLAWLVANRPRMEEKRMFGGIGWMLNGNMCVGIYKEFLIVRLGPEKFDRLSHQYDELRAMDITGKVMKGWGMIDGAACDDDALAHLTKESISFVETLPKQTKKGGKKK